MDWIFFILLIGALTIVVGGVFFLGFCPNALSTIARQRALIMVLSIMIVCIIYLVHRWFVHQPRHLEDLLPNLPLWIVGLWWIISELRGCRQRLK
jgi:hypothetical protein